MSEDAIKHLDALIAEVGGALRYQSMQYHLFSDDEAIAVLEKTCPEIWDVIQDALFDATVAAVGRLCDKDTVAGQQNITVFTVANELDSTGELRVRVVEMMESSKDLRRKLSQFRHKTVGHPDKGIRLGMTNEGSSLELSDVDKLIKLMTAVVDLLIDYANEPSYPWRHFCEVRIDPFFETLAEGQKVIGEIPR